MKKITSIYVGSIGFYKSGDDIKKAKIEKKICRAFLCFHPAFKNNYKPGNVRIALFIDEYEHTFIMIYYNALKIEPLNCGFNDSFSHKYHEFIDWVSNCQKTIDIHRDKLLLYCQKIYERDINLSTLRYQFERGNFNIYPGKFGNEDLFKNQ